MDGLNRRLELIKRELVNWKTNKKLPRKYHKTNKQTKRLKMKTLRDIKDRIRSNVHLIGVPKGETREKRMERQYSKR